MSKMITAKIDVTKIVKSLLFKGQKGTYLDLIIWVNDQPDKFGNDISIQQKTGKDDPKIYIGEGKFYVKKEEPKPEAPAETWHGKKEVPSMSNIDDLPGAKDDLSNLPF
jgi:hypothetical protein